MMALEHAAGIAREIVEALAPHCEPGLCVVGGSIRRKKAEIGDIEIVCVPKTEPEQTLFGTMPRRDRRFCAFVDGLGKAVRGEACGRYACRLLEDGTQVDLFMARRDNWGLILAIRTGSAEFAHALMCRLKMRGYRCDGGQLYGPRGDALECRDELALFDAAGLAYVAPEQRTAENWGWKR